MNYLLMVSHGEFAYGAHTVLDMMVGSDRDDVISVCLENDMNVENFKNKLLNKINPIKEGDNIIVLGDIVGGSPLTSTIEILDKVNLLKNSIIISGLNIPLAINTVIVKDNTEWADLSEYLTVEGKKSIFEINLNDKVEEEI